MQKIKSPNPVDLKNYEKGLNNPKVYYGLPSSIKFCTKCTYSNQKPSTEVESQHKLNIKKTVISFNKNGVCSACQINEKKKNIDWKEREKELIELCKKYKKKDGSYDCIVPGSGGKDSFYASHVLKYKYGMSPLTVTWAPHIYTSWGYKNFQSWLEAGFDNYLFTPNVKVHRLLTRLALENIHHPFQPFILGQKHFPPKIAADLNIPLVFYGENPVEYGNDKSKYYENSEQDKKYFMNSGKTKAAFSGFEEEELKDFGITTKDLKPYRALTQDEMDQKKIKVNYLGYFLPWHPQNNYYYSVENSNFQPAPERSPGTYDKYSSLDDKIDDLYWYTLFIKFGIGRATYSSSQEIRNGEIEREEGIRLVSQFDGEYPKRFEKENFQYLSIDKESFSEVSKRFEYPIMTKDYFDLLTDKFRSPHLWYFDTNRREWFLRSKIAQTAFKQV